MLSLFLILSVCLVLGAGFGCLYFRSAGRLPSHAQFLSSLDRGPERYRHLARLFSAEDFAFVERSTQGQSLGRVLRRERCRLLRVVLAQLRQEFEALTAIGSMLAVSSAGQADHLSGMLVRQTVTFYKNYTGLFLYSYWPAAGPGGSYPARLLEQVRGLHVSTNRLMAALTPQDLEQLRATFLNRS